MTFPGPENTTLKFSSFFFMTENRVNFRIACLKAQLLV